MPEDTAMQPMKPNNGHFLLTATGLAVLAIVFGLIAPPLGLILAIVALYKAGQASNRLAMFLSVLGIVVLVGSSTAYVLVYNDRHNPKSVSNTNSTYSYANFDDFKLPGTAKGHGEAFKKPTNFKATSDSDNVNSSSLVHLVRLPGYTSLVSVGSIDTAIAQPVQPIDSAYIKKANDAFSQQNSDYTTYKNAMINFLNTYVYPSGTTVALGIPKAYTNDAIKTNAWIIDHSATINSDDGTTKNIKGQLVYAIGAKNIYYFSTSALKANWDANTNTWNTVFGSLKIDQ